MSKFEMTIRLEREDSIPAFGAFLRCEAQHDENPVILINVQGCMAPLAGESQEEIGTTTEEKKRLLIETLMHEFGHALESHFRISVNEEAIERACANWDALVNQ